MDFSTHLLTSITLARGFFPGRRGPFIVGVVLAGTLADVDMLTQVLGPDAYLAGYLTVMHSLIGTVFVIAIAVGFLLVFEPRFGPYPIPGQGPPASLTTILLATSLAAVVHLLLDLADYRGIALLWPFRATRFSLDYLPYLDPWILIFLVSGVLLPGLLGLVRSEIGAKTKVPHGQNGAIVALILALLLIGTRAVFHSNAVAQLDAHSYRGESPRRIAALPDSLSLITWHGIVETASQICTADVPAINAARFDPEAAVCVHKPDSSPALTLAQQTDAAHKFLAAARFPKASVSATEGGNEVVFRDMCDTLMNQTLHALAARVLLDPRGQVTSQNIVWARNARLR